MFAASACNSGTESVEIALQHVDSSLTEAKQELNSSPLQAGFTDEVNGALSVTFNLKYRQGFEPLLPGCGSAHTTI